MLRWGCDEWPGQLSYRGSRRLEHSREEPAPGLRTWDKQAIGGLWSLLVRAVSVGSAVLDRIAGPCLGDGTSLSWTVRLVSEAGDHVLDGPRDWRELSILEVTAALEIL